MDQTGKIHPFELPRMPDGANYRAAPVVPGTIQMA
jgi:hypothetical protein